MRLGKKFFDDKELIYIQLMEFIVSKKYIGFPFHTFYKQETFSCSMN